MKQRIKNLLSKKPIKILIRVIGVLSTIFTIFILLIIVLGSCSHKEYDLNENKYNVIEVSKDSSKPKNIVYKDTYYYIGLSELGNEYIYNSLLSTLTDDAYTESINFLTSNTWYGGRQFNFTADDIGWSPITSNSQAHRFRYNNSSIYILMWTGEAYSYQCYGIRIQKITLNNGTGAFYYSYAYKFVYAGSDLNNVDLTSFDESRSTYIAHNFGLAYQHYNIEPGNPDYPYGVENHAYTAFKALTIDRSQNSYNEGYNVGFNQGSTTRSEVDYNEGYTAGYNAGYEVGIEQTDTTNLFSIIMQGFSAVSGVLNLQLMPGLTLGTLIFLPLAIMVVIVVFHLFKG